jgi:hypothetical protein
MMRVFMSVLAGTMLAAIGSWWLTAVQSGSKATGIAVLWGAVLSPVWWFVAVLFSLAFWGASRLDNRPLRIFLFWTPAVLVSVIGLVFSTLLLYLLFRYRQG